MLKECCIIIRSSQPASGIFSLILAAIAFGAALILDQISKAVVLSELGPSGSHDVITIIPNVLQLTFVRNTGSAFGMFQGSSEILKVVAVVAVLLLGLYFARAAGRDWMVALALGLQLGGAVGNIVDRFRHGYVVDWIGFPHFPTFNIADSAITVGVILMVYALLFRTPISTTPEAHKLQNNSVVQSASEDS